MKYLISELQLNLLFESLEEPKKPLIARFFKLLNEEKKKHKTRASILEAIKSMSPFLNINPNYSQYLLELYLLNYNKDGDYSNLTTDNFVDPRKMKGKWTPNTKANLYTIAQMPFKGSNLEGYWSSDNKGTPYYKVVSYGWYPVYIYKEGKWYEVIKRYSSSTSRQMSNANPVDWSDELDSNTYTLTPEEMKMLEYGVSHEQIMSNKVKKLKSIESDVSKRKKLVRSWNYYGDNTPKVNIKFKVNSIDVDDDKAIVTIDVFDVIKREDGKGVQTPENYLKGELPGINQKFVEDKIKSKMRSELVDYIGTRFRWLPEDPINSKVEFKFNHLKK